MTETLAAELSPLNIRVLLVAPGSFRTEGIYGQKYYSDNRISDYDEIRDLSSRRFGSIAGNENGDPKKAMEVVVDVVKGEGVAKGKSWPGLLVLGEDAERDVRAKCTKTLQIVDEWRDVSCGVNFD
jgi:NAD(P)-dependent dehydrogenase (short-subunit alcohol dehydrogenase family)